MGLDMDVIVVGVLGRARQRFRRRSKTFLAKVACVNCKFQPVKKQRRGPQIYFTLPIRLVCPVAHAHAGSLSRPAAQTITISAHEFHTEKWVPKHSS